MTAEIIAAATGFVAVMAGGVEMRLAMSRLAAKVDRIEERLGTVERKSERRSPRVFRQSQHPADDPAE